MTSFQYFPLDVLRREIRLLVVQPAVADLRDSPLEVSLIKSQLKADEKKQSLETDGQSPLEYLALSYTWGDPQPTFPVLLEGSRFEIRQNLYQALLHLRPTKGRLVIWIDAVCINQEDVQERESQVAMMRDIYKQAEGVWAWLGPGDAPKSRAAFMFLLELASREYSDITGGSRPNIARPETIEWIRSEPMSEAYLAAWLEIAKIFESPWFSRMWIIQEVVMGKSVTVACGSQATPFDEVLYYGGHFIIKYLPEVQLRTSSARSHSQLAREFDEKAANLFVAASRITEIGRARAFRLAHDPKTSRFLPRTVYQVVRHYNHFNVTEPRDKVYALLGILEDYENGIKCPKISYSVPLINLHWEIIKSHIEHTRSLDFLGDAMGLNKPCGTPTWMPQWDVKTADAHRATSILSLELAPKIQYKATANTLPLISFHPRLKAIRAVGVFSAVVRKVGEVATIPDSIQPTGDAKDDYARILEHMSQVSHQWVSMLDLNDVFTQFPFQLNLDDEDSVPEAKRGKAYTFASLMYMIDDMYKYTDDDLYALFQNRVENEQSPYLGVKSAMTHFSARQLATTRHRRLFVTAGGNFGLGPEDMQPDDVIVFFYGCRVPMVLRSVTGFKMWRIVGQAYCPYEMNGQILDPDLVAHRAASGLCDMIFCIV